METTLVRRITTLRRQPGEKLIWWLIRLQKPQAVQVFAWVGFVVMFTVVLGSWQNAAAMIMGMYCHELAHAFVFLRSRIKFMILMLFPLGAVAAPLNPEEDARSDQLPWNTLAWLLQAGPLTNALFIVLGAGLRLIPNTQVQTFGNSLVAMNTVLAAFNLIPWGALDAGQLFKLIFASLNTRFDKIIALICFGAALIATGLIVIPVMGNPWILLVKLIQNVGLVAFLVAFIASVLYKLAKDDPLHANSKQAMKLSQVLIHLWVYFIVVFVSLILGLGIH